MSALFLAIPLTIFLFFVAPLWLWLHYSNRSGGAQLSSNERQKLVQLTEEARQMRERIQSPRLSKRLIKWMKLWLV